MALSAAKQTQRICDQCGVAFLPASWCTKACSDACRLARKRALDKARDAARAQRPPSIATVFLVRQRSHDWAAAHRNVRATNHWLAGAPPFHTHLPGVAMTVAYDPLPTWPIELRNTTGLHGALTMVLGLAHMPRFANFALIPWQSGWSVYWFREDGARFAGASIEGALFDRPTRFRFGSAVRFRSPQVPRRGRQRIRIDTVTPVVIRANGGTDPCLRPTASHLRSAIGVEFLRRLAPSPEWEKYVSDRLLLETVLVATQPVTVPFGGKFGPVRGWEGHVVLEVNAVARWLLEVAARMGFGGRTALGCGRIRITEVP